MSQLKGRVLLLSIGTGDLKRPEETLLDPLQKSIKDGGFERAVLLPSQITAEAAATLRERCREVAIDILPLPQEGNEDDVDTCFDHFDSVISDLIEEGTDVQHLVVDFTRGTKAMSAALVLAAVRHEIPRMRYITGERNHRGMVVPGSEKIHKTSPVIATSQRQLDFARRFFREGNFAGVLAALPGIDERLSGMWPKAVVKVVQTVKPWAEFYSLWDRLDYKGASDMIDNLAPSSGREWQVFEPTDDMRQWVSQLSLPLPPPDRQDEFQRMGSHVRRIGIDLLANGMRRIHHRQYEDAFLRAYRVLELLGQTALFENGYDSDNLPADDEAITGFREKLREKGEVAFSKTPYGQLKAAREHAARFLKFLGDSRGKRLLRLAGDRDLAIRKRNRRILMHGYKAEASSSEDTLKNMYKELEKLVVDGSKEAPRQLETARKPEFWQEGSA